MKDWSSAVIVTCETCRGWTRNSIAPEGVGRCEGGHYKTSTAPRGNGHLPYPNAPRYCGHHRPAGARGGAQPSA